MEKVEDRFQERNEEDQRSNEQKDEPDEKNENIVSQQQADTLNLESVTAGKVEEPARWRRMQLTKLPYTRAVSRMSLRTVLLLATKIVMVQGLNFWEQILLRLFSANG